MKKVSTFIFFITLISMILILGDLSTFAGSTSPAGQIKGKDLLITKLVVVPVSGTSLIAGQPAKVNCTWRRDGIEPLNSFRLGVKIDGSPLGLPLGPILDKTKTGATISFRWTAVAGTHVVTATIDTENSERETNETNNGFKISITVGRALATDLTITRLVVVPEKGTILTGGQKAFIRCTWARSGGQPATAFNIRTLIDGRVFGTLAGTAVNHTLTGGTLSIPWTPASGAHRVRAFVDCQNVVTETNETNNRKEIAIKVQ